MNQDDFLERAIDQVARELTDGSPRHGFAGRVRQRLEAPRAVVGWRWQLAGAALVALGFILWSALPGPTVVPLPTPRTATGDRVLPLPPITAEVKPPAAIADARRHLRQARPRPSIDIRIPIDLEGAPQIAAIRDANALMVSPIDIPELTLAPLEPEKEPR